MNTVRVNIQKDSIITSYAEGYFLNKEFNPDSSVDIVLDKSHSIILYYHMNSHRRVYICCEPDKVKNKGLIKFVNVDSYLGVLNRLTGRAFARFKRTMELVNAATKGNCYSLPPSFFWELSVMCQNGHNNKICLEHLIRQYEPFGEINMDVFKRNRKNDSK